MNKKYAALFTASALLLTSLSAAENFPTSQFDYDGWYRPSGTVCPAQDAVATPRPTATPASAPLKTPAPSTGDDYTTPSSQVQEEILLNLLNQERIAQGLSPLTLDAELSRIARIKSADMRDNHYFSHESPHLRSCQRHAENVRLLLLWCGREHCPPCHHGKGARRVHVLGGTPPQHSLKRLAEGWAGHRLRRERLRLCDGDFRPLTLFRPFQSRKGHFVMYQS